MPIESINPATGESIAKFEAIGDGEIERRLSLASQAFGEWKRQPFPARADVLNAVAEILESEKEEFGRLMTLEMGKTFKAATDEAAKCATACRYFAENAERFLASEVITSDGDGLGEVRYQPLGTVLAIMPWNFPFWQVIRFAAPALMAGNVGLLKHASNVPQCALALEDLFRRGGAPDGVFQTLLIGSDRITGLLADPRVHAVTLTGSEAAGRSVASAAGKHLKKTVLELGGSDPFIVAPSADMEKAALVAVQARIISNGQSCIAAKRFIVIGTAADEFERRFVERMRALRVGDPFDPVTEIGPLATAQIRDGLDEQVLETVSRGARLLLGGQKKDGGGFFYEPTVLADIPTGSPAAEQELFGPAASIFRAETAADAIAIANDSPFGLAASAWTNDHAEADMLADSLNAGSVFINGMVVSDTRFPFGGVKASGYGRELGRWGIHEFVNVKTVRMAPDRTASPRTE